MPAVAKQSKRKAKAERAAINRFSRQPQSQVISPLPGETQPQFFERAMRAMESEISSINRRTLEVIRLWNESPNDHDIRQKAMLQFPESKYVHMAPRCVFIQHTIPSSDGRPAIDYSRNALIKLVNWANYRIRNNDMFSAISDGHTPTEEQQDKGHKMPDVLGYEGPFYLGMLGDIDPKWAIYADEWVHKEDVSRFEKLQRRSPEVWCNEPMESRTMDPIAALGAETPRLDSGMNPYSRAGDGRVVMRYSAVAAPGPMNSYVPCSESGRRRQHYGAQEMSEHPESGQPALVDRIMGAFQALLPSLAQGICQAIGGDANDGDDMPPEDPMGVGDETITGASDESGGVPRGMHEEPEPTSIQPDGDPGGGKPPTPEKKPPQRDAPEMDDEERRAYSALSPEHQTAYMAGRKMGMEKMRTQYSRGSNPSPTQQRGDLHSVVARQQVQIQNLTNLIHQRDRDAMRYSRLHELSKDYVFDVDQEMETVKDLNESQFERHCTVTVSRYAKRDDITNVNFFDDPTLGSTDEIERYGRTGQPRHGGSNERQAQEIAKYSRQAQDTAARKNAAKPGTTTFDQEFEALLKTHGIAT